MAVLRSCSELISRLLKKGGSLLLAAKILIISRLLHKKLSLRLDPPLYLEKLRRRLGSLRKRLLAKIDKRMGLLEDSPDGPLEAMCAFALATSSSASDVLRHFLHIRWEAITAAGVSWREEFEGPFISLRAYVATLKDVKILVPAQISSALHKLKLKPLLDDQELSHLDELNLDIHGNRLGDDIRSFTPYIRHDDLSRADVGKLMQSWSESVISAMLEELREKLQTHDDPKELAKMRRQILELWFTSLQHVGAEQNSTYVIKLRELFVGRWLQMIKHRSSSLSGVGELLRRTMSSSSDGGFVADLSLWSPSMLAFDPLDGAVSFRETLVARSQGVTSQLKEIYVVFGAWRQGIEGLRAVIEALSAEKWQDCFDAYDEDLGDDQWTEKVESSLSKEDPRKLQESLGLALEEAFQDLENCFTDLTTPQGASSQAPHRLTFLIQALRYIKQHIPLPQSHDRTFSSSSFGLLSIKNLHRYLASTVIQAPVQQLARPIQKALCSQKVPSKPLWEGDPPLPTLPSPWVFKLLQNLVHALADLGLDIWSPLAIAEVKQALRHRITSVMEENLKKDEATTTEMANGTEEHQFSGQAKGTRVSKDSGIQLLFDILYIGHASSVPPHHLTLWQEQEEPDTAADALVMMRTRFEGETKLDATAMGRMEKSAEDYWRRTSLLFGLLAA